MLGQLGTAEGREFPPLKVFFVAEFPWVRATLFRLKIFVL